MTAAIELKNISKKFTTPAANRTLQEIFLSRLKRGVGITDPSFKEGQEQFWALKNVSFSVPPGITMGLIGHNGAGKSSLLKLISGVLTPTSGTITLNGRISALLELGAGFHLDLTGRENIFLNGSILGLSRRFLEERVEEIIDFAELGQFIDMPVKHYSSGMTVRLGFAIATNIEPEILLIDEVLAVGDLSFQAKCINRINKMKATGTTIVFVSHNPDLVGKLCDEIVWLEHGRVEMVGTSARILTEYKKVMEPDDSDSSSHRTQVGRRWGSKIVEITSVRLLDGEGNPCQEFETGQPFVAEISYWAHQPIDLPTFGMAIHREDGLQLSGDNTKIGNLLLEKIEGEGQILYHIKQLPLLAGKYEFTAVIYDYGTVYPFDHHHRMYTFSVFQKRGMQQSEGVVMLSANWKHNVNTPKSVLYQ